MLNIINKSFIFHTIIVALFWIFSATTAIASKEIAKQIALISATAVYNLDTEELPEILKQVLEEHEQIKALELIDSTDNSKLLYFFRDSNSADNKKFVFNKNIPDKLKQLPKSKARISYNDEIVGEVILYAQDQLTTISLTQEEQQWIKAHPVIHVGAEMDWAPFDFVNEKGEYSGLAKDYLELISSMTGLKMDYQTGKTWDELVNALKSGEVDLLPALYFNEDRKSFVNYTQTYLSIGEYFFTRNDYPLINSIKDLNGKTLSLVKGYEVVNWVKTNFPEITILEKKNIRECLNSVVSGESDAFIGDNPSTTYNIEKNFIANIKLNNSVIQRKPISIYMGTKKGYETLQTIIDKAINAISKKQKSIIVEKWMSTLEDDGGIDFTQQELDWLAQHKKIRFSEVNWKPLSIISNNKMTGIMGDYLDMVSKKTGIEFQFIASSSWPDVLDKFSKGEIDLVPGIGDSKEELALGNVSDMYASYPMVIISNNKLNFVNTLAEVRNEVFSIPKYYTSYNHIKNKYPEAKIVETNNILEAITNVSTNKANIFIGHVAPGLYYLGKLHAENLKVAGYADFRFKHHFLISPKYPELLSIVNKVFASIGEKEREKIYNDWVHTEIKQSFDYSLIWKVALGLFIVFLFFVYNHRKLKHLVNQKTAEISLLLKTFDTNVVASKTDTNGIITYVSKAFCEISGYSEEELIGQSHRLMRSQDMPASLYEDLWTTITADKVWHGEIKNQKKNGESYWVKSIITPEYNTKGEKYGYSAVRQDITDKKAFIDLSNNLEQQVEEKTRTLSQAKEQLISEMADRKQSELMAELAKEKLEDITNSIPGVVYQIQVTDDEYEVRFISYGIKQLQNLEPEQLSDDFSLFINSIVPEDQDMVCDALNDSVVNLVNLDCEYRVQDSRGQLKWIHMEATTRELANQDNDEVLFDDGKTIKQTVLNGSLVDISSAKNAHALVLRQQLEIQEIHKHTRESIEYASLIQGALVPDNSIFNKYFQDSFAFWQPKDIVGGDIYFAEELRHNDEFLLMVIDCTGHGVPGAFVTMLVKAVERQIIAEILNGDEPVSPAKILKTFNQMIRHTLKQYETDSISNVGFDGGILYYDKKKQLIKFSGAETPLFILQEDTLKVIKGDRHSVGYKKSDPNYEFTEHSIDVSKETQIYLTTDGYLDQNGGEKTFPLGKKRFTKTIQTYANETFSTQLDKLVTVLEQYQQDEERNDDVTIVGFKL